MYYETTSFGNYEFNDIFDTRFAALGLEFKTIDKTVWVYKGDDLVTYDGPLPAFVQSMEIIEEGEYARIYKVRWPDFEAYYTWIKRSHLGYLSKGYPTQD